jgi:hypothetical protein
MQPYCLLFTLVLLSARLEAQLPVSREPHHTVILENQSLRLLEGKIPMNDTTAPHIHAANSVVIFLSHSTFGIRIVGDTPVITTVSPGDLKYVAYGDKPVTHIVWNQTPPLFHFYVVETAKKPVTSSLDLTDTQPLHLGPVPYARLLVAITGTVSAGGAALTPNQYRFFPPKTPIDLKGAGRCILLETR